MLIGLISGAPFSSLSEIASCHRHSRHLSDLLTSNPDMSTVDVTMEDSSGGVQAKAPWKQMGPAEQEASVHEEVKRMQRLPANSTYVTHRLRVLNKILQLLSIQRTTSQEQELELLFAGLSL